MNAVLKTKLRNMKNMWPSFYLVACVLLGVALSLRAEAHSTGQSYIFANVTEAGLHGHLELQVESLQSVIRKKEPDFTLDVGQVSDEQWKTIETYVRQHLQISQGGADYKIEFGERDTLHIEIADFVLLDFTATAPGIVPDEITVYCSAIVDAVPAHRVGLVIESNFKTGLTDNHMELSFFFAPDRYTFVLNTLGETWIDVFWRFVVEGVIHIWIGLDHVLFIVTLLLMSVVARAGRNYRAIGTLGPALLNVFKLVTLFTIAHTITLFLGLKGWVNLPARIVEPIIALSIVVVALNNIVPVITRQVGAVIFGFGLFHGLGFASVLAELTLGPNAKLLGLLGFNIGVELGQLAIVASLFPVLYLIREKPWYNFLILRSLSAVIALIGMWWFITRVFGIEI